jgi:lauroyl/myristoyl acyltransferase
MIVKNADKLVDPTFLFPFSFSNLKNDLSSHFEHGSKIILINHIAGFTLLINLVVTVVLNSTEQDILILYGLANIDLINKIRSNWIKSPKLHFILGDKNGLISLKSYLRHGAWLVALIDIPQEVGTQECQSIMFIRDQLYFKTGILRLSATFNLPILSIVHFLDLSGIVYKFCPIIRVNKLDFQCPEKQKQILESLFIPIAEIISKYPEQWFLWHKVSTKSI